MRAAVTVAAVLIPLQIFVGDQHGLNTLEHQPQKIAAMEALWRQRARRAAGAFRLARRGRAQQPLRHRAAARRGR
jgi:cytochrome d ubiquinol oxidase subunit I